MSRLFAARRWSPATAALLAVALASPSLAAGLQAEDWAQRGVSLGTREWFFPLFGIPRLDAAELARDNAALRWSGALPWLSSDGWSLAFFRPLSSFTHHLDYRLLGESFALMHLHSLVWLGLFTWLAASVLRLVVREGRALGVAMAVLACSGALTLTAGWLANRNALIAGSAAFAAVLAHARFLRAGRWGWLVLSTLCLGLGLAAGETAVAGVGWLLGLTLGARRRRALPSLAPALTLTALYAWAYSAGGWGARESGAYLTPLREPTHWLVLLTERLPELLLGVLGAVSADVRSLVPHSRWSWVLLLLSAATAASVVWLATRARSRRRELARLAAALLLSALPAGLAMVGDRMTLMLVPAAAGVLGLAAEALASEATALPPRLQPQRRRLTQALLLVYVLLPALSSPLRALAYPVTMRVGADAVAQLAELTTPDTRRVILLAAPSYYLSTILSQLARGRLGSAPLYTLHGQLDAFTLERTGDRRLLIQPEHGFLEGAASGVYRGSQPFRLGQTVPLQGVTVRVTAVDAEGAPTQVELLLAQSLEAPDTLITYYDGSRIVRLPTLALGERRVLPAP